MELQCTQYMETYNIQDTVLERRGKKTQTYVESISNGSVRRELTEPVNKHL